MAEDQHPILKQQSRLVQVRTLSHSQLHTWRLGVPIWPAGCPEERQQPLSIRRTCSNA